MKNPIEQDQIYKPLHPALFDVWGDQESLWAEKYIDLQLRNTEFDRICDEPIDNVYCFPFFTPLFCKEIIEEAEHYGQWTNHRQDDNPPIDILLTSFAFNDVYVFALKKYLYPLFHHQYQLTGEGWNNMASQNFIVRYVAEQQTRLGLHHDGSYLSMVTTLNTDYEGGGTVFPKFRKLIKNDKPGYATIHPGLIGYIHGALPVTKGRRYILTSFFYPEANRPLAIGFF